MRIGWGVIFVLGMCAGLPASAAYNIVLDVEQVLDRSTTPAQQTWQLHPSTIPPSVGDEGTSATDTSTLLGPDGLLLVSGTALGGGSHRNLTFGSYASLRSYLTSGPLTLSIQRPVGLTTYSLTPDVLSVNESRLAATSPLRPQPGDVLLTAQPKFRLPDLFGTVDVFAKVTSADGGPAFTQIQQVTSIPLGEFDWRFSNDLPLNRPLTLELDTHPFYEFLPRGVVRTGPDIVDPVVEYSYTSKVSTPFSLVLPEPGAMGLLSAFSCAMLVRRRRPLR